MTKHDPDREFQRVAFERGDRLAAEIAEAVKDVQRQWDILQAKLERIDKMQEALRHLTDAGRAIGAVDFEHQYERAEESGNVPPAIDVILAVMGTDSNKVWAIGELIDAVENHGWLIPPGTIRTALSRADSAQIERPARGKYKLADVTFQEKTHDEKKAAQEDEGSEAA